MTLRDECVWEGPQGCLGEPVYEARDLSEPDAAWGPACLEHATLIRSDGGLMLRLPPNDHSEQP